MGGLTSVQETFGREPVEICRVLEAAGHDAVIVGGPVRDALRGERASDVDLATSATPDEVRRIFPRTFVQGSGEKHGTVGVIGESGETFEVTTYRLDIETDGRHARVAFTDNLEEDLLRRDFTINAIAVRCRAGGQGEIVDPLGGRWDLNRGIIRAVGEPGRRFGEDHLRILRAYRFSARLGFEIESETRCAMVGAMDGLYAISQERIRDEIVKLAGQARDRDAVLGALLAMQKDGAIARILPELEACVGVTQNEHHAHTVFRHSAEAAAHAAAMSRDPRLFLAALLHDVGKPRTRAVGSDGRVHFYEHEEVGARVAETTLARLRLPTSERRWVVEAVRQHMRLMAIEEPVLGRGASARRAIGRLMRDLEHVSVEELLALRIADKSASGVPGRALSESFIYAVEETLHEIREEERAFKITDLAVSGHDAMDALGIPGGPRIGRVLAQLLDDVVEERVPNERSALLRRIRSL